MLERAGSKSEGGEGDGKKGVRWPHLRPGEEEGKSSVGVPGSGNYGRAKALRQEGGVWAAGAGERVSSGRCGQQVTATPGRAFQAGVGTWAFTLIGMSNHGGF